MCAMMDGARNDRRNSSFGSGVVMKTVQVSPAGAGAGGGGGVSSAVEQALGSPAAAVSSGLTLAAGVGVGTSLATTWSVAASPSPELLASVTGRSALYTTRASTMRRIPPRS
ncbi:hypothetical protein BE08_37755 [Sorangium cellulosum]|uniref:Uncharacterized protein n=1 Tax=Sorangium cellulosum TaxID=56 RepID=A0A150P004_SORCE|nr:hypothetical protein BE08_37755 [Sorangium cellulosum]